MKIIFIQPDRFEPVFILKKTESNQTEPKPVGLNWFRFFLKKFQFGNFF
jgi:hypothetical protein